MNQTELIEFLNEISENGVSYAHGKGYEFFKDILLPNIMDAEHHIDEKQLIADCWYIIGDIYDFNGAPLKAIESYRKAIQFDPEIASAYREMGNIQVRIGEYENAVSNIKKAIKIDAIDKYAVEDLKDAENSLRNNNKPLYTKDDFNWKLAELLANQSFEDIIKLTEKSTQISELKKRASAFGGLFENENFLAVWKKIEHSKLELEIEYCDWFYMPDKVYESDTIWRIFKQLNSRIKSSIFIQSNSLIEFYKELSDSDRRELMCDFQIYDNTNNADGLSKLRLKYPNWEEVKNSTSNL
jgi:tetratricopeptide (TPR) repeat protein